MPASNFVLVNRRLDTPGVVVAGRSSTTDRVELFFRPVDDKDEQVHVRVTQESTGLGITLHSHQTFRFVLSAGDSLWVSASRDIICWQVCES